MLYLDKNKKIHSKKPQNFLCEVEATDWDRYEFSQYGKHWKAEDGKFIKLVSVEELLNIFSIKEKIANLESNQTPRMLRGAALGNEDDKAMLSAIEAEIAELRSKL